MSPERISESLCDELHDLRLMREMLAEAVGLPSTAPVSKVTARARTCILLQQAEDAFDAAQIAARRATTPTPGANP